MPLPSKLTPKPSPLPKLTSVTGSNLKQNHSTKPSLPNQATPSIIDSSSNISVTATNFDNYMETNIINVDGNKFYDYHIYFPIPINICPV